MKKNQYKRHNDEIPLDDYEKELKEFLDKGRFVNDKNFDKNKTSIAEAAKRYLGLMKAKV